METVKEFPYERKRAVNAGFLLVLLCFLDAVFTHYGLNGGYISEANRFVSILYEQSILLYYTVKLGLPLVLLYLVMNRTLGVFVKVLLTTALFLYIAVLFIHLFWLIVMII